MKRLIWIPVLAFAFLVTRAYTQDAGSSASLNADRAKQVLTMVRRDIFEMNMELTDGQKDPFWSIYNQYEKDRGAITDRTFRLVQDYATQYPTLTGDQAIKMAKESASNQKKQIDLRSKYADQIAKKVDPKVGARFFQIDDYITTAARLDVLDNIPFIGDAD